MAASPDNVYTAEHGATVIIPCTVTRNDGTTIVYKWYRDGVEVGSIPGPGAGTLVQEGVSEEDRGRYVCVVEITASGVGGQPLEETIGAVTIGVGGRNRLAVVARQPTSPASNTWSTVRVTNNDMDTVVPNNTQ